MSQDIISQEQDMEDAVVEATASTNLVEHLVALEKDAGRQLGDDKIRIQLDAIVNGVNTAQRTKRGWTVELADQRFMYTKRYQASGAITGGYVYSVLLLVKCQPQRMRATLDTEFHNILTSLDAKGVQSKWSVALVDSKTYVPKAPADLAEEGNPDVGYAPIEIPANWMSHFDHLYGLDSHINRVRRALDAAVESDWRNRFHCVLVGPPGCGKSDICQSVKNALGEEAVLEFDGTSTSMAGAQKELSEREELPRVLLVEEIEKAPEGSLAWLLSVLDLRGEVRKTTAKGNILRDTRMLCIATVNDYEKFRTVMSGALASRFAANRIFFQRPSYDLLTKILVREIERVGGNMDWIEHTLDYATSIDTSDPREIIGLALCGRDGLLDGSFQRELRETAEPTRFVDGAVHGK